MKSITLYLLLLVALIMPIRAQKDGAVECGLLIYGGTKTSRCFSDEFLSTVQQKTSIATERRFKPVKLASDELFKMPFVILTGEGDFNLTPKERENFIKYVGNGGFLLASAGCSNADFNTAFQREVKQMFGASALKAIAPDHAIYRTVFDIKGLPLGKSTGAAQLQGLEQNGKMVVLYSPDGLNDSHHADGCCCCGGNEISNALQMNANILAYALLH
jgi:hypothetical protein